MPAHKRLNRPTQPQIHQGRYTLEEKRRVVKLIDEGWRPLDVALLMGMRVWDMYPKPGRTSYIYRNYTKWADQFALQNTTASQKTLA